MGAFRCIAPLPSPAGTNAAGFEPTVVATGDVIEMGLEDETMLRCITSPPKAPLPPACCYSALFTGKRPLKPTLVLIKMCFSGRGHGTQLSQGQLIASVCGVVDRIDKLLSVHPTQGRYKAQLGDVVVGRVTSVVLKRWKLDIAHRQEAVLQLSAIDLPGGAQVPCPLRAPSHRRADQAVGKFERGAYQKYG